MKAPQITIVHCLPSRVRLAFAIPPVDPHGLAATIGALDGVTACAYTTASNRMLVQFDPRRMKLLKILKRHCEHILDSRPKTKELSFDVQHTITTLLSSGQCKIDAVAWELGMSTRTLMRRLAEEGLTYKGLLDDVRRRLALEYLKDRHISVKHVAYLLGYSEVSAFYHAFHRWTGSSPLRHRLG